jgi:hypothetical protein
MKITYRKYAKILEKTRMIGIPDWQVFEMIRIFKEEYLKDPETFGDLLEVLE